MKHHTLSLVLLLSACVFDDAVPTPRVDDAPGEVHLGTLQSVQPTAADTADATPDADPIYVDEEPVYQHVRIVNHEGKILDTTETGALTLDQAFRVARPYSYMGPSEAWLYQERAWSRSLDDGRTEHGYAVTRSPNDHPVHPPATTIEGPAAMGEALRARLADAAPDEAIPVDIALQGFPDWDIPPVPAPYGLTEEQIQQVSDHRTKARKDREDLMDAWAEPLIHWLEAQGTKVDHVFWEVGYLSAHLTPKQVRALRKERRDISSLTLGTGAAIEDVCTAGCDDTTGWAIGNGRRADRLDADQFLDKNYNGEQPNDAFHSFRDITIGIIESGAPEDEACLFADGPGNFDNCVASSRLRRRFTCSSSACSEVTSFATNLENDHATGVASIALGDYQQFQGSCERLGDTCYTGPGFGQTCGNDGEHCTAFQDSRTGMAPEASAVALHELDIDSRRERALLGATAQHVDIINNSWRLDAAQTDCNIASDHLGERLVENAFDEGILVVSSAGNNWGPYSNTCNVGGPADLAKNIAVNGLDTSAASCLADYGDCLVHGVASARGGGDATFGSYNMLGALSHIDMIAPGAVTAVTSAAGVFGDASATNPFVGTSAAVPHVAGVGALVKDWMLDDGHGWINSPGRLQTMLMSMTDRGTGSGRRRVSGSDDLYGLGRLKARLLNTRGTHGPFQWNMRTISLGGSTPGYIDPAPFLLTEFPTAAGTDMVKCTMVTDEDMSHKDNLSYWNLSVEVMTPNSAGQCDVSRPWVARRGDGTLDTKKMAYLSDADIQLDNKCFRVRVDNVITTNQGLTAHLFCYTAGEEDFQ